MLLDDFVLCEDEDLLEFGEDFDLVLVFVVELEIVEVLGEGGESYGEVFIEE